MPVESRIAGSKEYLYSLFERKRLFRHYSAQFVEEFVEAFDADAADGLLASIRKDYDKATRTIRMAADMEGKAKRNKAAMEAMKAERDAAKKKLDAEISDIRHCRSGLLEELKSLQAERDQLQKENGLLEMLPAERSRVLAYEKALEIGMKQLGNRYTDAERAQVIRSASNVAGGFMAKEESKV